jgi:hypothetical protein
LGGFGAAYSRFIEEKYGKEELDRLWELKNKSIKIKSFKYQEMIEKYKKLQFDIEKEKSL